MTGKEFLEQLEKLLKDLPEHDRQDAMAYYKDYLEEAGPENEALVLQELGSPEKVAETIKRENMSDGNEQAEYTERGYSEDGGAINPNTPSVKNGKKGKQPLKQKKHFPWALVIILLIFASPVLVGVLGSVFGAVVAVLGVVFGLGIALIALVAAGLIGGVATIVYGFVKLISNTALGLLGIGAGILLLAVGLVLLVLTVWILFKVVPAVFRLIVDLFQKLLYRIRGGNRDE